MRSKHKKGFAAILVLAAFCLALFGAAGDASAYSVKTSWERVSAVAGETLTTGQVVCIKDADGYAYKADANDSALRPAVGIIGKGGSSGARVEIIVAGVLTGWTTLSEGTYGYLSETAAAVTQSAPSYAQVLGLALTTTDYLFQFKNYFDTSAITSLGVLSGASPIVAEGATANDYETTITVTDPTADRTVTIPDKSGTVQLSSAASALTPGAAVTLTVGLSNVYTDTVTDNEDQTITFSGAGTAGDELMIVFLTAGTADEVITFHATLVSSTGTLTLGTDAGKYYVVRFVSNGTRWFETSRTAVQT